jgi:hypothetical protein
VRRKNEVQGCGEVDMGGVVVDLQLKAADGRRRRPERRRTMRRRRMRGVARQGQVVCSIFTKQA